MDDNNTVMIENSNFTSCNAEEGGGAFSLVLEDSLSSFSGNESTILHMKKCTFHQNTSPMGGSAVGLVTNARIDQFFFVVHFNEWLEQQYVCINYLRNHAGTCSLL